MRKNKNRNEFNTIYEKMGRAVARPSPLLGPPMFIYVYFSVRTSILGI